MDNTLWPEVRRSQIQIIAEILRLLRLGEVGKTEIMYTIKMSYSQLQKYLNLVLELRLADTYKKEHNQLVYVITKKGFELLTRIGAMQETLRRKETPHVLNSPRIVGTVNPAHTFSSK